MSSIDFLSLSDYAISADPSVYGWDVYSYSADFYSMSLGNVPVSGPVTAYIKNLQSFDIQVIYTAASYYTTDTVINVSITWGSSPHTDGSDLTQQGFQSATVDSTGNHGFFSLVVTIPGNSYVYMNFGITDGYQFDLILVDMSSISIADVPCLCRGMLLLTPSGPRPVEDLQPGDLITTPDDARHVPIVRVFHTDVPSSDVTRPYRIPKDFCGKDYPIMDILLSPHHAFFDFRDQQWKEPCETPGLHQESEKDVASTIDYYHIELPNHEKDKLICQNLGVDSYLENHPL